MNRFEDDFNKHVARPKKETLEHYQGELEKLNRQVLDELFKVKRSRPELPLDSIVGLVNWRLDLNISDDVIARFKKECGHG